MKILIFFIEKKNPKDFQKTVKILKLKKNREILKLENRLIKFKNRLN